MTDPRIGTARLKARLSSAVVLGLLCAVAALLALDPAARAGATTLAPVAAPLSAPVAPQSVMPTVATGAADDGALQTATLVTATRSAVSTTGPIHYGTITALPVGGSARGSASGSGPDAGNPGRLAPQSGGVKYDNLSTFTNGYVPGSPAAATGPFSSSVLVGDNITLSEAVDGLRVTQFVVALYNNNPGSVSAEVNFDFWYDDGASGGPGTYFKNASGAPVGYYFPTYLLASGLNLLSVNLTDAAFTFPAGRKTFWAGVVLDNQGLPGTTAAQLDQIGQVTYDPPAVGSSTDTIFKSSTAGNKYNVNSPAGFQTNFGGSTVANLGWRFTFDNICPTVVTTTVDSVAGSLRSALACATPGDTITFTLPANSVIGLTGGELTVTKAITIDGSTAVNLAVSGNNASRVFSITAPVNVVSLTVMNGNVTGRGGGVNSTSALTLSGVSVLSNTASGAGAGAFANGAVTVTGGLFQNNRSNSDNGGGLFANSTLALTDTTFFSNSASYQGGGALVLGVATLTGGLFQLNRTTSGNGGGLNAQSTLALTGTTFLSNTASGRGGGAYVLGVATLNGGVFQNNRSNSSDGGGLNAQSTLALTGTQFISNTASSKGGGAYANGAATLTGPSFQNNRSTGSDGGGLYTNNTLALTDTTFFSNTAASQGGGAYAIGAATLTGGLFQLNKATSGSGGGLNAQSTLALTGTQFLSNTASSRGGGAYVYDVATLTGGLFQNNHSTGDYGGGLYAHNTLALTDTTFLSNAAGRGGGAYAESPATLAGGLFQLNQATASGGGLYVDGTLALTDTQFISNSALGGFGGGGGVYVNQTASLTGGLFQLNQATTGSGGGLTTFSTLALTGTQFLGNTANTFGGGVYLSTSGSGSRVVNAVFARNVVTSTQGAALYLDSPNVQILFTTIAGSPAPTSGSAVYVTAGPVGITDTIVASYTTGISTTFGTVYEDYNLFFGDTISRTATVNGGAHDVFGDPKFVNAATDDYHLRLGSAAIDTGVDAGVYTDLDGIVRPQGGFDIGAYEYYWRRLFLPLIMR